MRKVWWLLALLAITAVVYAQVVRVVGARGFGFAGPENNNLIDSQFMFQVYRALRPDTLPNPIRGAFQFNALQSSTVRRVSINVPRIRSLEVDLERRTATFSGPATAILPFANATQRVTGFARIYVEDNTRPDRASDTPDFLRVEFFTTNSSTPNFVYEGVVKRGDIEVFELTTSP